MSDFCPVYDWDYSNNVPIVHYNCIPLIYWLPWFFAGLVVGLLPFIIYLWRNHAKAKVSGGKPEVTCQKPES